MKRQALIRHLEAHGCYLLRDRGKHCVYVNPANNQYSGAMTGPY
jgi:predicted RNA binding protein YcfA (HicA-like mRNA interferase family)